MESFSRRFQDSPEPWFKVGQFGVGTSVLVAGMAIISMFVWAVEGAGGPIFRNLILVSDNGFTGHVLGGQIWRLATWPIPNEPSIWTLLLVFIFVSLGGQLERAMGKYQFTVFLATLTLLPAIIVTALELVGLTGSVSGLRFVEIGVLVAFAAYVPTAQFFFGIPAWAIAGVIVGIDVLTFVGARDNYALVLLLSVVGIALFGIRAYGMAEEVEWIPKLPLPAWATGEAAQKASPKRKSKRGRGNLAVVPNQREADLSQMEMDALLDQVARDGLDSLSRKDRKRLEDHSKKLRDQRGY